MKYSEKHPSIPIILEQVISASQVIPRRDELSDILTDAKRADERGYFLPDEDERLRQTYANYLRMRTILLESIHDLEPFTQKKHSWQENIEAFAIAFVAAAMLVRSATYVLEIAKSMPVIWKKLDEAELRYGIKRKSLTRLYKSVSSPLRMWRFHEATRFYYQHKEEIISLKNKAGLHQELIDLLELEEELLESKRTTLLKRRFKYQLYSFIRRHHSGYTKVMFHLFRLSGSTIAEMKQPFKKVEKTGPKRVTQEVINEIQQHLHAGDIIVTRHEDALSNLFLPGFWPHAALYAGSSTEGIPAGCNVIESKKDGVKFRALEETLFVDCFLVLRPLMAGHHLDEVISRAMTHVGKRYDFIFDFTKANRLACTELVYRAYHSVDNIDFHLQGHTGRLCISAEDLIDQAISSGRFECLAVFGLSGDKITYGNDAATLIRSSYTSKWSI